jgi:glycosyltransferase involved in cell wall biosynthesis
MTKLIIQIPCFNEEKTLAQTLADLPRELPGIERVEWLVIDDGSTDRTAEVARAAGVDHVVRLPCNQGLARGFMAGLEACIDLGADIIVNTDADNQYRAADIPKLIEPILAGRAELVIGERPIDSTAHFSASKKLLEKLGSWVVRYFSQTHVVDAPSGFRAMTRAVAKRLNVFSNYTYTIETIIQAGQANMAVASVPIRTNPDLRPSRLVRSIPRYIWRSMLTIVRIFMAYQPLKFFAWPGIVSLALGLLLCLRYLVYYFSGEGSGHVQSVLLAVLLIGLGIFLGVVGLLADLMAVNRKLLEKVNHRVQNLAERVQALERGEK